MKTRAGDSGIVGAPEATVNASVMHGDAVEDVFTTENCWIREWSNTPDDPDVSLARARVAPGTTTRWHRLRDTVERYLILEGTGRVELGDGRSHVVGPGDVVRIPPACPQRIANIGSEDLIFLAVCTPRFRPEIYEDVESNG